MSDLTVGALAARTGLTIRTLHHYDAIGLLSPSGRTDAGYRLYSANDIRRLQTIVLLRGVGLGLDEISQALSSSADAFLTRLDQHAADMRRKVDEIQQISHRLDHMIERLRSHEYSTLDDALADIRALSVFDKYFDRVQLQDVREHASAVGAVRIREAEAEWPRLIAAVRHEMALGTSPNAPQVQVLAERWQELVDEFVNGRFDIGAAAGRMMHAEPTVRQRTGLDAAIVEYIARATALLKRESTDSNRA
jgi:DNA-binding transcriptional MerR regulator